MNYGEWFDSCEKQIAEHVKQNGALKAGLLIGKHDIRHLQSISGMVQNGLLDCTVFCDDGILNDVNAALGSSAMNHIAVANASDAVASIKAQLDSKALDFLIVFPDAASDYRDVLSAASGVINADSAPVGLAAVYLTEQERQFFLADVFFAADPSVDERVGIVETVAKALSGIGIDPKIAMLSAVEVVNPGMPVTVEAEEIAAKANLENGFVQGPLSMDVAVSPYAAEKKKAEGEVPGKANVLVGPNLTVSKSVYQAMSTMCKGKSGVVLLGGAIPVALPGRGDGEEAGYLSTLLASVFVIQ